MTHSNQLQVDLGQYCRTGHNAPDSSIPIHIKEYRRLVYNVVYDTLEKAYPLVLKHIGENYFEDSVQYFFSIHPCQTPQIWQLPKEFLEFYQSHTFPFESILNLNELMLYEWLEVELFMMEDEPIEPFSKIQNSEQDWLIPNPEIRILPLSFPYHLKDIDAINTDDKGQYFVAIYRHHDTKIVDFLDLSYPYVEALIKINEHRWTITKLIESLHQYEPDLEKVKQLTQEFIVFAIKHNILLGFQTPT